MRSFLLDVLIPIKHLLNGDSIVQEPVEEVAYYHIELSGHEVLLAEGRPVESFLDTDARSNLSGSDRKLPRNAIPTANIWEMAGRAPLVVTGPIPDAARRLVNALAADPGRSKRPRTG